MGEDDPFIPGGRMVPRAVLKNGIICPVEPLPAEWSDGQELVVEAARQGQKGNPDPWVRGVEEAASRIKPEDDLRLEEALREIRRQAKQEARRDTGLS
jgi:hypothetical protein